MQCSSSDINSYFEHVSDIGGGSFGVVYRARVLPLARKEIPEFAPGGRFEDVQYVAIKLSAENVSGEIDIMKKIDGHWTGKYYGCFVSNGHTFIVMELCQGVSLAERLLKPIEPAEKNKILLDLALALQELHKFGIVHRDIKPENIMLCNQKSEQVLKLVDYGLSSTNDSFDFGRKGSARYIDPQMVSKGIQTAVDLWSYGQLAYYLYTGELMSDGNVHQKFSTYDETKVKEGGAPPEMVKLLKNLTNHSQHPKRRPNISQIIEALSIGIGH